MPIEIAPEAPAQVASIPTLDPRHETELRRCAAKYRAKEQHMQRNGYVVIYCGGAVGWTSELKWPRSWVPGCYAVPADNGAIYIARGGTAANGAEKWEALK